MKKTLVSMLCFLAVTMCICTGCTPPKTNKTIKIPPKPDTALEFWIAQDVSSVDFSAHNEIQGWMGAKQYYGKGYRPIEIFDERGNIRYEDPKHCVKYLVGAYPDYADGGNYITRIDITDPNISVYGINCRSSFEDFDAIMQNLGYTVSIQTHTFPNWEMHTAALGKVSFKLFSYEAFEEYEEAHELTILVEVTNRQGISY